MEGERLRSVSRRRFKEATTEDERGLGGSGGSSSARLAGVREFVREFVRVFVRVFVRSSVEGEHGDDDQAEARVDVDWWC